MPEVYFGKGKRLSGQTCHSLPDGTIEPFDVIGGATILGLLQLVFGNHTGISIPDIAVAMGVFITGGNTLPEHSTSLLAPTTDGVGHDLSGATTERQPNLTPNPTLVLAPFYETPD